MYNESNKFESITNVELLVVGDEKCKPCHSEGPTVRNNYLFHYILDGKGKVIINGNDYLLKKGNGFLITYKDYIYYEADQNEPWHYMWIIIKGNEAESFFSACGLNEENPIYVCDSIATANKQADLFLKKTTELNNLYSIYGALYEFWGSMIGNCHNLKIEHVNEAKKYVMTAKKFISVNSYKKITVNDICKSIGIDRTYLFRLFQTYEKMSPQKYIISYKMNYAKMLLSRGDLNVNQVAASVGYSDQCAFSRIFSNYFNRSPKSYIPK